MGLTLEEIELELCGPCIECLAKKQYMVALNSGSARIWCMECGGSGSARTYRIDRGTYDLTYVEWPAPYWRESEAWR